MMCKCTKRVLFSTKIKHRAVDIERRRAQLAKIIEPRACFNRSTIRPVKEKQEQTEKRRERERERERDKERRKKKKERKKERKKR